MAESAPPRFAMWLLKHFASVTYRESLIGDLIEQRARGRTRAWCWRQVMSWASDPQPRRSTHELTR